MDSKGDYPIDTNAILLPGLGPCRKAMVVSQALITMTASPRGPESIKGGSPYKTPTKDTINVNSIIPVI